MSLLDTGRQRITVYPDEEYTDPDGNPSVRPSKTGIETNCRLAPAAQSGTSARRAEQDMEGFTTEEMYRLRFPRSWTRELGPEAKVVWNGQTWGVFGFPMRYDHSRRTAHHEYMIRRS